jgi:hypothetical protein
MPKLPSCKRWPIAGLAVVFLWLTLAEDLQANVSVYPRVLRSTGWIAVPGTDGVDAGTCFVMDREQRLILTCAHVLGKASEALIYFPRYRDGEPIVEASYYLNHVPALIGHVIAKDALRDLALIQVESRPADVEALALADRSAEPGEAVHSIGNSALADGGMLWRYTRGYVRLVYPEPIKTTRGIGYIRVVETQSPVNKGDSGGPVVDDQCRLVGVTDSYAPHERLVSESIDVLEVQHFLQKAFHKEDEILVRDVDLPEAMKRSMARQAEAERDRRAKVINAEGEFQAAERLRQAAEIMTPFPIAMQMRYLQALADVASDQNSTIIFPLPLELMRLFLKPAPVTKDASPLGNSQEKDAVHQQGNEPGSGFR